MAAADSPPCAEQQRLRPAGAGKPQPAAAHIQRAADGRGEGPGPGHHPAQAAVHRRQNGGRSLLPAALIPEQPQVHGVQGRRGPVTHDIRHNERIPIRGRTADGTEIAADHVVWGAMDAGRQPRVIDGLIQQALRLDSLGALKVAQFGGHILERLHAAHDPAVLVAQRSHADPHRDPPSTGRPGEHDDGNNARRAGRDGAVQRAELLPAELSAILIDVAENLIEASLAQNLAGRPAGDPLGRLIPVDDPAIQVGHVDTRVDGVEHLARQDSAVGKGLTHFAYLAFDTSAELSAYNLTPAFGYARPAATAGAAG